MHAHKIYKASIEIKIFDLMLKKIANRYLEPILILIIITESSMSV